MKKLFTIKGIDIGFHRSGIILITLILNSIYQFFKLKFSIIDSLSMSVIGCIGLMGSLLWHEMAHALIGGYLGMKFTSIQFHALGGAAMTEGDIKSPKQEFLMAIAGPLSSALLAIPFTFLAIISPSMMLKSLGLYLGISNIMLAVFNMIPAFPMDGGRCLRSIIWAILKDKSKATKVSAIISSLFSILAIVWGINNSFWMVFMGGMLLWAAFESYRGRVD